MLFRSYQKGCLKVELQHLASIIQGNIPTRIEVDIGEPMETITMQELNYIVNVSDDLPVEKYLIVQNDKSNNYTLTKQHDVIVGLNSGRAMVIEPNRVNKLVLSNLAIIRIKDFNTLDPYYLCWFINNNKNTIKKMQQGTASVSIIPLTLLKVFDIPLISIKIQQIIGEISELKRQRDRLTQIIETKKTEMLTQQLAKIFEKETNNGNK